MKEIETIAGLLLMSRDAAHRAHLATLSYAKHVALNEFYDGIVGLMDSLVEAAQGKYGILDIKEYQNQMNIKEPCAMLKDHLAKIERAGKGVQDRFLQNILDEISALYYTTIYKCENLS